MSARGVLAVVAILAGASLLLSGCTEKLKPPPNAPGLPLGPLTTPDSVQVIFDANCIGCHIDPGAAAGLDLTADSSYQMIVNHTSGSCAPFTRVDPFHPEASCLLERITGRVAPRMPFGGPALSSADTSTIRNWIVAGAPGVVRTPTP